MKIDHDYQGDTDGGCTAAVGSAGESQCGASRHAHRCCERDHDLDGNCDRHPPALTTAQHQRAEYRARVRQATDTIGPMIGIEGVEVIPETMVNDSFRWTVRAPGREPVEMAVTGKAAAALGADALRIEARRVRLMLLAQAQAPTPTPLKWELPDGTVFYDDGAARAAGWKPAGATDRPLMSRCSGCAGEVRTTQIDDAGRCWKCSETGGVAMRLRDLTDAELLGDALAATPAPGALTDEQIAAWDAVAAAASAYPWAFGTTPEGADPRGWFDGVLRATQAERPELALVLAGPEGARSDDLATIAIVGNGLLSAANAKHIAWASPTNVRLLLAELRDARAAATSLRGYLDTGEASAAEWRARAEGLEQSEARAHTYVEPAADVLALAEQFVDELTDRPAPKSLNEAEAWMKEEMAFVAAWFEKVRAAGPPVAYASLTVKMSDYSAVQAALRELETENTALRERLAEAGTRERAWQRHTGRAEPA